MKLQEVRAIVTGAANGLGRCFSLSLLEAGAQVAAGDVDGAGLRQLRTDAEGLPGLLTVAGLDITEEESIGRFFAQVAAELGGANVLINNAGVLRDGLLVTGVGNAARWLPAVQWRSVLEVNLTGQFLMARELAVRMIERGAAPGVIVNISSLARTGNAGQSSYSASKAGLDAAMRSWSLELAPHGIRVGSIAPGVIDTPILEGISGEALRKLQEGIPLGRIGRPEEVWLAVRFILECDFFTGRTIEIDGGAAMGA